MRDETSTNSAGSWQEDERTGRPYGFRGVSIDQQAQIIASWEANPDRPILRGDLARLEALLIEIRDLLKK
jgi:hypothetical protein